MSADTNGNARFAAGHSENTAGPHQSDRTTYCPGNSANAQQFVFATAKRSTPKSVWTLAVKCPFCEKLHKHGGGIGETPSFGHRVAHCGRGGYQLVEFQP